MGAIFALILAIFYKQFSLEMLKESLIDTAKTTAMVFIILFGAAAFTGVFMSLDGDQIIANWVLGMGIGKWGAFAIMCVIVFILGMFIDWLGIVMIVFPIFLPIMDQFGFDRLWLVAVTATLLQTCFMTPPSALLCSTSRVSCRETSRSRKYIRALFPLSSLSASSPFCVQYSRLW